MTCELKRSDVGFGIWEPTSNLNDIQEHFSCKLQEIQKTVEDVSDLVKNRTNSDDSQIPPEEATGVEASDTVESPLSSPSPLSMTGYESTDSPFTTPNACNYTAGGPCFKKNSNMRKKCNREATCGGCVDDKGLSWTDLNQDCYSTVQPDSEDLQSNV